MKTMMLMAMAFLFLKTGEKFATQETAGPTVAAFTTELAQQVGGGTEFAPQVFNDPGKAAEFVTAKKPAIGIVTTGFYLAYAKALGMELLLEVQRQGVEVERYVLVMRKDAGEGIAAARGRVIATSLGAEERFVIGVILQDELQEVRLRQVNDLEGTALDVAEKAKNAPDAVLMEEALWNVLAKDEELGPKLKAVYRSPELPGALVVAFPANAGGLEAGKLRSALKDMKAATLANIRVEKFTDSNRERLQKAEAKFHGR